MSRRPASAFLGIVACPLALLFAAMILAAPSAARPPKNSKSPMPPAAAAGVDAHPASQALSGLDAAPGLLAQLFASEPMMTNPTNIDVDERGRVWVCEVMNYRGHNGWRPAGDRILILEDTTGSGKADKCTVFYQGRDIDSAMGICVLGNRVIVSCSPNVFVFTNDGHDKVARKEVLFAKTGTRQHDHSAHKFVFGPDGRLYWNFGNQGLAVNDKNGQPVVDLSGHRVVDDGHPYFGGMVFRCEPDGSRFEVLAHNFRNNYEVAVDSFGSLWQSDNDDDGNRGVRINYVMEYGNYGYRDEMTGASWQTRRTNMEREIPLRHWHLNDPGVVPNLLQTGAGAPCGMIVYEGDLLPKVYRNQMIHTDAGPNIVRAYPATPLGAGYQAHIENMLYGARDNWFRPVDVSAAPDGSVFIADWYDPGVGGHQQGDEDHGRVFRLTTPDHSRYAMPKFDYATPEGAASALTNPCQAVRYLGWTALHEMGAKAEPALVKLWHDDNPRFRARALWLLARIEGRGEHFVDEAIADADSDIRITGLRVARQTGLKLVPILKRLVDDPSPAVRRECAIALRNNSAPEAAGLWASLALKHDGKDRWYLEALGIGAEGQWDKFLAAPTLKAAVARLNKYKSGGISRSAWNDIVWRSRARTSPTLLAEIIRPGGLALLFREPETPTAELPRYLRAFDFQQAGPEKDEALWRLAATRDDDDPARANLIAGEAIERLGGHNLGRDPRHAAALARVLDSARGTAQFVLLVDRFSVRDRYGDLLALAQKNPEGQLGVDAVRVLLDKQATGRLSADLASKDEALALATATVLGTAADGRAVDLLAAVVRDQKRPLDLRREAARGLSKSYLGAKLLVKLCTSGSLDPRLKDSIAVPLSTAPWADVRRQAAVLFPLPQGKEKKLPPIAELIKLVGHPQPGRQVFLTRGTCVNCHRVGNEGKEVGPNLSEIGDKLSNTALYESILYPSASIAHSYETYQVVTTNGNIAVGLLVDKTAEVVRIKNAESIVLTYKTADIDQLRKLDTSLMPADLQKVMSTQDLADLVAYLTTLKKPKK